MRSCSWISSFTFTNVALLLLFIALGFEETAGNEHEQSAESEASTSIKHYVLQSNLYISVLFLHQFLNQILTLANAGCVVCDSLKDESCLRDHTVEARFTEKCNKGFTWCYKSEGNITLKDKDGHKDIHFKVHRGCTKMRQNDTECVHVEQSDETNFKICFCPEELCNKHLDVSAYDWREKSGGHQAASHMLRLFSVVFLGVCIQILSDM